MRLQCILFCALVGLAWAGCSKKPVAEDSGSAEKAAAQTPNPQINADLAQIDRNAQAREYDAAVGSLLALKGTPKTDAEEKAYAKQLHQTSDMLMERAAHGDQKAEESYRTLGRLMTGR